MNVRNRAEVPERTLWARAVKAVAVIYCGVLPAIVAGMTIVSAVVDRSLPAGDDLSIGLGAVALLLAPVALYAAFIRTDALVVVVGTGLVALQTWSTWAAFTGESSTSGLAILWIPVAGVPFVLVGWFVDAMARSPDA
jgi:hypothetical protein